MLSKPEMRPKLSAPPPLVAKLTPAITQSPTGERERSRYRADTQHWRAWYRIERWRKLRWAILTRDLFTCQRCLRLVHDTANLVCDHIQPHRGDPVLFWREDNLQALCKPCHDKHKQSEEHGRPDLR